MLHRQDENRVNVRSSGESIPDEQHAEHRSSRGWKVAPTAHKSGRAMELTARPSRTQMQCYLPKHVGSIAMHFVAYLRAAAVSPAAHASRYLAINRSSFASVEGGT